MIELRNHLKEYHNLNDATIDEAIRADTLEGYKNVLIENSLKCKIESCWTVTLENPELLIDLNKERASIGLSHFKIE